MLGGRWGSPARSGAAGGRASSRDGPVVRAGGLDREANRVANARDLLGEAQAVSRPRLAWGEDHRVAARIARVQARRQLGAQLAGHLGAQELALPVGREPEGQELRQGERVGGRRTARSPCAGAGTRPGAGDRRPPAFTPAQNASSSDRSSGSSASASRSAARRRPRVRMKRSVSQPGATGDLGQPSGADPAVEVELPEAVLSVAEALAEPQVVPGLGADVGNSPAVAADLDRALEPVQPQAPVGPRKRPAKELIPEPGRGGRRQRRRTPRRRGRIALPVRRRSRRRTLGIRRALQLSPRRPSAAGPPPRASRGGPA